MNITNADIKNLKDKKYRRDHNYFMVEGDKFCRDLLDADIEIVYTLTTDDKLVGFPNICVVSDKQLATLSTTVSHQTIICICKIKKYPISCDGDSLILDNLQDAGNVGTLVRSALAFGFRDIYLVDGVDPYNEKVIRSSAGTILKVRLHVTDRDTIIKYRDKITDNFVIADMSGESIDKIHLPNGRLAVIIGNEGQGVSDKFMSLDDIRLSIPMAPEVESLNAGVAGSIIMQRLKEVKNVRT